MGSLASHISAFLFLFPIGIRRLLSAYSLHLKPTSSSSSSSSQGCYYYLSKPWYFSTEPYTTTTSAAARHQHNQQRLLLLLKNLDLYALLVALPIAAFSEFFLFLTLSPPLQRLPFSHQSAVLSLFWLLLLSISLRHSVHHNHHHHQTNTSSFPDDLVFLLAALVFLAELFLTGGGGTAGPSGSAGPIEGRVYELLSLLTLACAASCLALAARRTAFAADVVLSAALAFKGTWVLQAGVCLFGFPPKGCHRPLSVVGGGGSAGLECELEEDRLRGLAVVDLLFVGHAVGIAVCCLVLFALAATSANRAEAESSSSAMMRPMMTPEFEMD